MGVEMVPAESLTRPVHGRLTARPARERVGLVDGPGAAALAIAAEGGGPAWAGSTRVIVVAERVPEALSPFAFAEVAVAPDREAALALLADRLARAHAGAHVAIAGSDTLIGLGRRVARVAGIPDERVETELAGSAARRVQCIHCKSFVEEVVERRIVCPGCGLTLSVRDHYSRRLAAYQAVWVGPGVAAAFAAVPEEEA